MQLTQQQIIQFKALIEFIDLTNKFEKPFIDLITVEWLRKEINEILEEKDETRRIY